MHPKVYTSIYKAQSYDLDKCPSYALDKCPSYAAPLTNAPRTSLTNTPSTPLTNTPRMPLTNAPRTYRISILTRNTFVPRAFSYHDRLTYHALSTAL